MCRMRRDDVSDYFLYMNKDYKKSGSNPCAVPRQMVKRLFGLLDDGVGIILSNSTSGKRPCCRLANYLLSNSSKTSFNIKIALH